MGAPAPTFIPEPFATGASGSDVNFPIPDNAPSSPANLASWHLGFPAITMQPEVGGGLPPLGQDFNGILLTLSQHTYAQQAGQPYVFNASFAGSISGYALGAVLGMADGTGLWFNITAGNETNPDTASTPSGWVPAFSYGLSTVPGLTGGTVTLTPAQAKRNVIVLSGTLASNLIVVLPPTVRQWLIVNATTGGFTTTVQTAAGTGVTVPQGGSASPTPVWGDGTNIYNATTPLTVAISQAPTPSTLVERSNAGYVFATYFNQNSAYENWAITGVWFETGGDGYLRKMTLANFAAQLFSSPAFSGVPTAATAPAGTSNTQLATTAFVNPGVSKAANGWEKRASGMIEQWGVFAKVSDAQNVGVGFNIAFPSACVGVWMQETGGNANSPNGWVQRIVQGSITTVGFTVSADDFGAGAPSPTVWVYWRALGY